MGVGDGTVAASSVVDGEEEGQRGAEENRPEGAWSNHNWDTKMDPERNLAPLCGEKKSSLKLAAQYREASRSPFCTFRSTLPFFFLMTSSSPQVARNLLLDPTTIDLLTQHLIWIEQAFSLYKKKTFTFAPFQRANIHTMVAQMLYNGGGILLADETSTGKTLSCLGLLTYALIHPTPIPVALQQEIRGGLCDPQSPSYFIPPARILLVSKEDVLIQNWADHLRIYYQTEKAYQKHVVFFHTQTFRKRKDILAPESATLVKPSHRFFASKAWPHIQIVMITYHTLLCEYRDFLLQHQHPDTLVLRQEDSEVKAISSTPRTVFDCVFQVCVLDEPQALKSGRVRDQLTVQQSLRLFDAAHELSRRRSVSSICSIAGYLSIHVMEAASWAALCCPRLVYGQQKYWKTLKGNRTALDQALGQFVLYTSRREAIRGGGFQVLANLPPCTTHVVVCRMTSAQLKRTREVVSHALTLMCIGGEGGGRGPPIYWELMSACRWICISPCLLSPTNCLRLRDIDDPIESYPSVDEWLTSSNKVQSIMEYATRHIRDEGRVIVLYTTNRFTLRMWRRAFDQVLPEAHALSYDGSMESQEQGLIFRSFVAPNSLHKALLCTSASLDVGVNLSCASVMYIDGPQYNPAVTTQLKDRMHRIGQGRPCDFFIFSAAGITMDTQVMAIAAKREVEVVSISAPDREVTNTQSFVNVHFPVAYQRAFFSMNARDIEADYHRLCGLSDPHVLYEEVSSTALQAVNDDLATSTTSKAALYWQQWVVQPTEEEHNDEDLLRKAEAVAVATASPPPPPGSNKRSVSMVNVGGGGFATTSHRSPMNAQQKKASAAFYSTERLVKAHKLAYGDSAPSPTSTPNSRSWDAPSPDLASSTSITPVAHQFETMMSYSDSLDGGERGGEPSALLAVPAPPPCPSPPPFPPSRVYRPSSAPYDRTLSASRTPTSYHHITSL